LYANVPILSEKNLQLRDARLALLWAFSLIVEESFDILWISLPSEM
jgi:arginyl-tRNA synthetase